MTELQRLKALSDAFSSKLDAEHRKHAIAQAQYEATLSALMDARQMVDIQVRDVEKAMAPK